MNPNLQVIPGTENRKIPMLAPEGSVIYWDESGELMMKWPHPCEGDKCLNNPCCEDVTHGMG